MSTFRCHTQAMILRKETCQPSEKMLPGHRMLAFNDSLIAKDHRLSLPRQWLQVHRPMYLALLQMPKGWGSRYPPAFSDDTLMSNGLCTGGENLIQGVQVIGICKNLNGRCKNIGNSNGEYLKESKANHSTSTINCNTYAWQLAAVILRMKGR